MAYPKWRPRNVTMDSLNIMHYAFSTDWYNVTVAEGDSYEKVTLAHTQLHLLMEFNQIFYIIVL